MADIDVVPKRSSSALIWVLVALAIVALLLWFLFGWGTDTTTGTIGSLWPAPATEVAEVIALA